MFSTTPSQSRLSFRFSRASVHHLEHLLDSLEREVLALGADQRVRRSDERVDRQQPERRRAVDQDHLVLPARLVQRALEGQLASHLAAQHELRLGEPEVGGDHVLVDRVGGARAPGEHLADRRRRVGIDVEVVGEVALRDRGRPASTSSPMRRKTSVSVRTIVVLPVPPFCERTAIVGLGDGRIVGIQTGFDGVVLGALEPLYDDCLPADPVARDVRTIMRLPSRTRRAPARRRRGTREEQIERQLFAGQLGRR